MDKKFPPPKPNGEKVIFLWVHAVENSLKGNMTRMDGSKYDLKPITEKEFITKADWEAFRISHLDHMSQFGGDYKEKAEKFFVEVRQVIDGINGWKD